MNPAPHDKPKRQFFNPGVLVVVAVVIVSGVVNALNNPDIAPKTENERALQSFADELSQDPELAQLFEGTATVEEAEAEGLRLAQAGLVRLDDATLAQRAEIITELLATSTDQRCAALARGTLSVAELNAVLDTLPPATYASWLDLSRKAALAELHQDPVISVSDADADAVLAEIEARLTPENYEDVIFGLASPDASDAELCWATRTVYELLPDLSNSTTAIQLLVAP